MDRFLHAYVALTSLFATRRDDEEGATAVEYGLIVTVIALVMVIGAAAMGTALSDLFDRIALRLGN